jgi:hypothetical protein
MMHFSKKKSKEIAVSILEEIIFLKREVVFEILMMKLRFKEKFKLN